MRIASKTIYDTVKFNLGNITENLYKAHKVVATGKRITGLSDDPVGLTQVLNIKSTLSNIAQLGRNIDLGKSWLIASESALSHVQNMISEARALCVQMATETMGAAQRTSAAETVQNMLEEIVSLANTEVSGRYIFAGSETNTTPFTLADNDVTYNGDDNVFTVKIDRDATVQAGSDGEDVFWDETVTIDATNNKIDFIEYSLGGSSTGELTATIQSGTYTHNQLATAIRNAMNNASDVDYVVTYDSTTKKFTIQDDGTNAGFEVEFLWATGTNADTSVRPDIGFDATDIRDSLIVSDNTVTSVTITATVNDTIEFKEDIGNGLSATLTATITADTYDDDTKLGNLADDIETQMEDASLNGINYEVTYDTANDKFIIEEEGTDLQLKELQILWNSGTGVTSLAATALGFDNTEDDVYTPPTSDNEAKWGIFDTLIDLKGFLEANDVAGISKSITRLSDHFDHFSTKISDIGSKRIRMEIKTNIFQDLNIANTDRLSNIEDADITEAIMDLKEKELAYQAALASSARVMELSLMDYL